MTEIKRSFGHAAGPEDILHQMVSALKKRVTIQPGGLVEIRSDELKPGAVAEVIVLVEQGTGTPPSLSSFVGKGQGCFSGIQEVDRFIRSERDAWER